MRYVTTQPITIPAGTEFELSDALGAGGLEAMNDRGLMRVFLSRADALRSGLVVTRPVLRAVK